MAPIIEFRNITKRFGGTVALDHVSFQINKGEVHCLCGENGAGKSTLINLCSGVLEPTEGTILIHGREEKINSVQKSEKLGFAIVHQEVPLCLNMSIAHNIFLGSCEACKGVFLNEQHINQKTKELLDQFQLKADPTELLGNLSIAEQSMIQIAKALYSRPEILILDEPTAALTNNQREVMFDVVRKMIKEQQTTVLYVSHRLEEVMELGDRMTVFKDGKFVATKNVSDVTIDDIISMMVGREIDKSEWGKTFAKDEVLMSVEHLTSGRRFHDISFSLRKGEILGLAGFVGAGRTEVLSSIFGIDKLDSGEIHLKGKEVKIKSPRDAIRHGISLIPENRRDDGLVTTMSIQENAQLTVPERISTKGFLSRKKADRLMQKMIKSYSIKVGKADDGILTLSGGNQQKVVIAKWIGNDPEILLCDEPTRGIDVGAKAEVYAILREIASKGIGIVVVSSELPELLCLCDRILVMHEGKITGELSREDATEELIMKAAAAV
ncbi:sugar ABC transporter ATP-binding protein [Novisyntrophococcus fermenticellae]|uniref:sugar ABC transporter ATP-binding protein n=1 Tax=Novisyntrophococcus fermenticellae TaxID=2068655 RepID=UPI001E2FE3DB|nr:sugar ABC transporter ATP-binding protein [Novisyntrophococcus fermenticellae]